jgi:NAD(P)H-hydrate repair Nnr-like enzyme with NAD(P)H-hydrate dehydratase domain
MNPNFLKQSDEPLFPKVLWNRPVATRGAGRLLVLSGHSGDLGTPQTIYAAATAAGVGECSIVLPDAVRKLVGDASMTYYVPSSPSGSLGRASLAAILDLAEDYDAIAIGGGLSQNSETTMLIDSIISETDKPIILSDDALTLMKHQLRQIAQKPNCLILTDMVGLIKASGALGVAVNIRQDGGIMNKVEILRNYLAAGKASYVVVGTELIVGVGEQVSVTPYELHAAAITGLATGVLATFWLQNQTQTFEGLTTGSFVLATGSKAESKTVPAITKAISKAVDQF